MLAPCSPLGALQIRIPWLSLISAPSLLREERCRSENDDFDFEKILNYACSSIDIETITIPTLLLSPGSINQKVEEIKKLCHDDLIIVYMLTIIFSDFYLNSKLKQA